jgi:hypothetical protein
MHSSYVPRSHKAKASCSKRVIGKMSRSQDDECNESSEGEACAKLFTKLSNRVIILVHSFKVTLYQWAI